MKYTEALQNPDFKKIWQRVTRDRYPQAKSLEECFMKEKGLSQYKVQCANYGMYKGIPADSYLSKYFDEYFVNDDETFYKFDEYGKDGYSYIGGTIFKKSFIQYIGADITLDDILSTLNKGRDPDECAIYFSNGNEIIAISMDDSYYRKVCDWIPKEHLLGQTPETWKAIARSINESV